MNLIILKWREGWSVNADTDRVSDHPCHAAALAEAERLASLIEDEGEPTRLVDLSED